MTDTPPPENEAPPAPPVLPPQVVTAARWADAEQTAIIATVDGHEVRAMARPDLLLYRQVIDGQIAIGAFQPTASELKAYAADVRWRKETGGIVVGGISMPTDDRAKVLLIGAASSMADEATAPFVSGTTTLTLTGAQFKGLFAALTAHVQACFATQSAVLAAIDAGTITSTAAIDAAFA